MRVIIAGSRHIQDYDLVVQAVDASGFNITEVVCGEAKGADTLGKWYAKWNQIPYKSFPAKWNTYGRAAGFQRNAEMSNYADAAIVIWDGYSKGSANMIDICRRKGMPCYVEDA